MGLCDGVGMFSRLPPPPTLSTCLQDMCLGYEQWEVRRDLSWVHV